MAAQGSSSNAVTPDTLITIKITVNDSLKKLKLPLRDLGAATLSDKLRHVLAIKPEQTAVFERFSDSAGGFITLDPNNPQVYKTLIRAAKAKLKLRLKATVTPVEKPEVKQPEMAQDKPIKLRPLGSVVRRPVADEDSVHDPSAAFVSRSNIGSGIFQFRDAQAHASTSQQTLVNNEEVSVPQPSADVKKHLADELTPKASRLSLRPRVSAAEPVARPLATSIVPWSVFCNECDKTMPHSHFHCSLCDGGDYDLCEDCVAAGKLCPGEGHWLIKRFFKDGKVVNSTTERISPRAKEPEVIKVVERENDMPGTFTDDAKASSEPELPTRTCNSCVVVLPEHSFVTCVNCEDFDLCLKCHTTNQHGHHPAHVFEPATADTALDMDAKTMLAPGRNVRHNALCDGCDKKIYGIRHKCLTCPDWDYCNDCMDSARATHPHHRFAPLYAPIADPHPSVARHYGIYCDGPLCTKEASYITGVRYKCAVCHDTDFCASCEALPSNHHNRTHPLIKFKTPVRNVSITTENEDFQGKVRMMGDRREAAPAETRSASTETAPVQHANAATQVQTLAEIKPSEIKEEAAQPIPVYKAGIKTEETPSAAQAEGAGILPTILNAHFVQDSVPDGCPVDTGSRFAQIWTVRNPGPHAWPSGCSVRYVGGDNMLNVDNLHPASVSDIADATESNVVGREVQVGEEISFKVILKAPTRLGKSISYWRLKAADGTPFGHRLWCDITVIPKPSSSKLTALTASEAAQQQLAMKQQMAMKQQQQQMQQMAAKQQQQIAMRQQMQQMAAKQQQMAVKQQTLQAQIRTQAEAQAQAQAQAQMQAQMQAQVLQSHAQMKASAQLQNQTLNPVSQPPSYESPEAIHKRIMHKTAHLPTWHDQLQARGTEGEDLSAFMPLANHFNDLINAGFSGSNDDKARKEAAKQRVEHIKAKIMKTREERAKLFTSAQQAVLPTTTTVDESVEKTTTTTDAALQRDEVKQNKHDEEDVEGSQMVFPKLDKESPASSTYVSATSSTNKGKAAYVENEAGEVERSATPDAHAAPASALIIPSPGANEDFDDLTDLEVLSAEENDSDDGFLTDEEYDILDASDQETVATP